MTVITDPSGSPKAKVDFIANLARLETRATTEEDFVTYGLIGRSYIAYFIIGNTALAGTEFGVAYLKNENSVNDMVITTYDAFYGTSTGGTGNASLNLYNNPSESSTIVTAGAPGIIANARFGDSNPSLVSTFVGDGTTARQLTPGPAIPLPTPVSVARDIFRSPTIIPFGQSIGFSWTPPAGNTSQQLTFIVSFYMREQAGTQQ